MNDQTSLPDDLKNLPILPEDKVAWWSRKYRKMIVGTVRKLHISSQANYVRVADYDGDDPNNTLTYHWVRGTPQIVARIIIRVPEGFYHENHGTTLSMKYDKVTKYGE